MKKLLCAIPLFVGLLFTSCYGDDINEIKKRLDTIEGARIASIQEQIDAINKSLPELKKADEELSKYIESIQSVADSLEESILATDAKIDQVRNEVSTAKSDILAQLASLRAELMAELEQVNSTIDTLKAKDTELENKIADLQSYVDTELASNRDWANATFATLAQYNSLAGEVAAINEQIENLTSSITELESRLSERIATEMAATLSNLDSAIQERVEDITNTYTSAIATAKQEITAAYTAAIAEAISTLETSMKSWVNEQLSGYYTISEIEAKLEVLEDELNGKLSSQRAYLEGLISSLSAELSGLISDNSDLIEELRSDVNSLQNSTAVEAANKIAQNATAIAANAQSILDNAAAISSNSADIEANNKAIDANATLIAENKSAIAQLDSAIANSATDIANNAENIAKNADLITQNALAISNNTQAIAQNSADILKLQQDLITMKGEITAEYNAAIATAIATLNGTLSGEIATKVAQINSRIDNEVAAINSAIETLSERVTTLENEVSNIKQQISNIQDDIARLMARIQSVSYVPRFSDGKASLSYNHGISRARFDFEISPKETVAELANVWESALSVKAVLTLTRAVEFIDMPIVSFSADPTTGVISMWVSGENIPQNSLDIGLIPSAALVISDGNNQVISEYVPMVIEEVTKEIWYTTSNDKILSSVGTIASGENVVMHTYEPGMGVIRFDAPITQIVSYAFDGCNYLKEITIPNTVTSIGYRAFYDCDGLETVNMGNNVESIDRFAFANCASLKTITIPNSVTSISSEAFLDTQLKSFVGKNASPDGRYLVVDGELTHFAPRGLTAYSVPNGITKIGDYAFAYCPYLESVSLPTSVTEIGDYAFEYCNSLTSIELSTSLIEIGAGAFNECKELNDLVIPESVTKIGDKAFYYCWKLTEITIPRYVADMGANTFANCLSLAVVHCKGLTPPTGSKMFSNNADEFAIYVSIGALSEYRTSESWTEYNDYIQAVVEPNAKIMYTSTDNKIVKPKVEAFGLNLAYNSCDGGIGMMVFDGDITTIGDEAFKNCTTLKTITYPESVTAIGAYAFAGCTNLAEVEISENIGYIGSYAFSNCPRLESVTINGGTTWNMGIFQDSVITNLYVNCNLPDSYNGDELRKATYKNVIFGDSVTSIGSCAFANQCSISNLTLGNNVETIGNNAFASTTIESVVIPNSVTELGRGCFASCTQLTNVVIGTGLSTIADSTFHNCTSLKSITIPANVTYLDYYALNGCSALSEIYCKSTTPPSLYDNYVLAGGPADRTLYVPEAAKSTYQSTTPWKSYRIMGYDYTNNTITPPANNEIWYTTTDGKAISIYSGDYFDQTIVSNTYQNGLGVITFSGDLTVIKNNAFTGRQIKTIYIPASVTTLPCFNYDGSSGDNEAAFNSSYLEEVHIAGTPKLTGNPFALCEHIKKFSGPLATADGRALVQGTTLYSYAFGSPEAEFTIPSTVKTIGIAAFYHASGGSSGVEHNIQKINIPASVTTIKFDAFYDCRVNVNIASLESWCKITFGNIYANPIYTGGKPVSVNGSQISTLTIPTTITSINKWAFAGVNVDTIEITDNVTTIADNAFDWNKAKTITIGKKVSSIGVCAFRDTDSYNTTKLYVKATTPPNIESNTFSGYTNTIYVPSSKLSTYKSSYNWRDYSSQLQGYTF